MLLGWGPLQLYPAVGWADPIIYLGYFKHYDLNIGLQPPLYFPSRLPFILLGKMLYAALSNQAANYLMSFLPMLGFLVPLWVLVRYVAGVRIAWITTMLAACNTLVLAAVTQGYVVGLVMTFLMAGFAILITNIERDAIAFPSFAAGFFLGLAALTHPNALTLMPESIGAILIVYPSARKSAFRRLGWGLLGVVAIALAAAAISKILNQSSSKVFLLMFANLDLTGHDFAAPFWNVATHLTRQWYLLVALSIGIAALYLRRNVQPAYDSTGRAHALTAWATLSLATTVGYYGLAQLFIGISALAVWFYAAPLSIYCILIVAGVTRLVLLHDNGKRDLLIGIGTAIGCVGSFAAPMLTREIAPSSMIFVVLGVGGIISAVFLAFRMGNKISHLAKVVGATLLGVLPLLILSVNADTRHVYADRTVSFRDASLAADDADEFIRKSLRGTYPVFWYIDGSGAGELGAKKNWRVPIAGNYPLFYRGKWLNLGFLDMVWYFYYTRQLDPFSGARGFATSNPDWRAFGCDPKAVSLVILSRDKGDNLIAVDRLANLFGTKVALNAAGRFVRGKFGVNIWMYDIAKAGRPPGRQLLTGGFACAQ